MALFALAFALALPGNGERRPLDAHETFVARTAVEMERRGDYVVPYYSAHERLQKPPLSYWLAMLAEQVCSDEPTPAQSEFSARLPSMVLGAATAALAAALGWLLFDSLWVGVLAALLFATSHAYLDWSRSAQPEMAYTFACTAFVLAAARAQAAARAGRGTWLPALAAWTAIALAILAKGPILPAAMLVGAAIAMRRGAKGRGILRTLHLPAGVAWALALAVPYFAVVAARVPGALEFWRSQMFDRTGGLAAAWWKPLELYYVGQLIAYWMPWSLLLPVLAWQLWRTRGGSGREDSGAGASTAAQRARFLAWIALVPCAMLSFSAGRKGYYLLPTFPLFAVLLAWSAFEVVFRAGERIRARALRAQGLMLAGCALIAVAVAALRGHSLHLDRAAWSCVAALLALALGCAAWSYGAARRSPILCAWLLSACAVLGAGAVGVSGVESRSLQYTVGDFARAVALRTDWDRPLVALDGDMQVLLFYTDRPVRRLEPEELPGELAREPLPWIVTRESERREHSIPGRVVVREDRPLDEDALVLVDPTFETGGPAPTRSSGGQAGPLPRQAPAPSLR